MTDTIAPIARAVSAADEQPRAAAPERFIFANQLRGVAAVAVVINHLAGVYWAAPQLVAAATFTAPQTASPPGFTWLAATAWYNLGPFGVGLFFLISGLVIPISLERQSSAGFLVARVFRIFPTYLVAFAIELAVLVANSSHWHQPLRLGHVLVLSNATLTTDITNVPSIDLVNWTLTVELKFYLLMALIGVLLRKSPIAVLLTLGAIVVGVTTFSHEIFAVIPALGRVLRIFESNALYVLFMLIGVVFSFHLRGSIRTSAAVATVLALFAAFVYCWPHTFFRGEYPSATINYGYALAVFSVLYALRRFARPLRILDFFAAISYPLYLVHALIGFSIMQLLIAAHVSALVATLLAFGCAIALAGVLHVALERPSQDLGKRLGARVTAMTSARR